MRTKQVQNDGPGCYPAEDDRPAPHDHDQDRNRTWLALLAALLLIVLTVFLMVQLKKGTTLQDCIAQGRHNCVPIDTSQLH
jgi:hypothetical protein